MVNERKPLNKITIEEMDLELITRGNLAPGPRRFNFRDKEGIPQREAVMKQIKELYAGAPPPFNKKVLGHIGTWELAQLILLKSRELNRERGIWGKDNRMDYYKITDEQIKKNAHSAAAICMKKDLIDDKNGFSTLKHKNYGKAFNLCDCEPFHHQPIAAGRLCTGFLVKEDMVATAGHCANEENVTDLRFFFGYIMSDSSTPVTQVPNENVYKGVKIVRRVYNPRGNGADWALVKLDRNVVGQEVARLSKKEISPGKRVYIIGYPLGLPLKYSPGASISDISETHFSADLNVYCGSSGSPVFDSETHEVIGIVVRGDNRDFRLVENCWMSIIYSRAGKCAKEPQCTRVSQFIDIIDKCCE